MFAVTAFRSKRLAACPSGLLSAWVVPRLDRVLTCYEVLRAGVGDSKRLTAGKADSMARAVGPVVRDAKKAATRRAMVEQAVAFCPTKALRIEED